MSLKIALHHYNGNNFISSLTKMKSKICKVFNTKKSWDIKIIAYLFTFNFLKITKTFSAHEYKIYLNKFWQNFKKIDCFDCVCINTPGNAVRDNQKLCKWNPLR